MELETITNHPKRITLSASWWYILKTNPMALAGLIIMVLVITGSLFASILTPYDPTKIDIMVKFQPPSLSHWFGTDEVGRDILTRVLYGGRLSLGVGILVVVISGTIGMVIGAISGYMGGIVDQLIMRIMDMMLAFPMLILAMALTAALGPSLQNAVLALVIVEVPLYVRLARGQALVLRETLYVKSAVTFGMNPLFIILRHIIPNAVSPLIIQATLDVGNVILMIATLGFLGLGAQPPTPEWGAMISVGWKYLLDFWWYPVFPGLLLFLSSAALNLIGDGLRDILDPKSHR